MTDTVKATTRLGPTVFRTSHQERLAEALAKFSELPSDERENLRKLAQEQSLRSWQNTGFDGGQYDSVEDCIAKMLEPSK